MHLRNIKRISDSDHSRRWKISVALNRPYQRILSFTLLRKNKPVTSAVACYFAKIELLQTLRREVSLEQLVLRACRQAVDVDTRCICERPSEAFDLLETLRWQQYEAEI